MPKLPSKLPTLAPQQQQLVTDNLRLVDFVARKIKIDYGKHGLEYEDIQAIGRIGLIKAASKFDLNRNNKFTVLAVPYIRGEIIQYLRDKTGLIHTPRGKEKSVIYSYDKDRGDSDGSFLETLGKDDNLRLDDIDEIRVALWQLSPQHRQVLTMFFLNHLNKREIADWLECTPVTAGRWLEDAKLELKRVLTTESNLKNHQPKRIREDLPYKDETGIYYPHKHHCQVCGNVFGLWKRKAPSQTPKTCSNYCAKVLATKDNSKKGWSQQEIDYILNLVGKYDLAEITRQLYVYNYAKGLPRRSLTAVKVKIARLVKTVKRHDDNWNARELARQLEIPVDRVRVWCKQGLESTRTNANHRQISRQNIREFAQSNPWRFTEIKPELLSKVLQDNALVKLCSQQLPHIKRIEIFRTDTKTVYPSVRAAARDLNRADNRNIIDGEWLKVSTCVTHSTIAKQLPDLSYLKDKAELFDPKIKHGKTWEFISPDGTVYKTNNLSLFAKVHGLIRPLIAAVHTGKNSHHKGWKKYAPKN